MHKDTRQGKEKIMSVGSFRKICPHEIFFLTREVRKKNMLSEETVVVPF